MRAQYIKHELLDPVEYYLCDFRTEQDIKDFEAACPWFKAEDVSVMPGESCVIMRDTSPDIGYYEKLPVYYFKQQVQKHAQMYAEVNGMVQQFFRQV